MIPLIKLTYRNTVVYSYIDNMLDVDFTGGSLSFWLLSQACHQFSELWLLP